MALVPELPGLKFKAFNPIGQVHGDDDEKCSLRESVGRCTDKVHNLRKYHLFNYHSLFAQ